MAITVAEVIWLCTPLVDGQLYFEVGFVIAQINKRKAFEIDALGDLQTESLIIEGNRLSLIKNAYHRVDGFGHYVTCLSKLFAWFYWPFG
jgi:hypothetical protein